jgi:hypothetical protein
MERKITKRQKRMKTHEKTLEKRTKIAPKARENERKK